MVLRTDLLHLSENSGMSHRGKTVSSPVGLLTFYKGRIIIEIEKNMKKFTSKERIRV